MFETAQKYSEQSYYSKTDIEKELDHYLVEPIWHEICQYRSLFRYEFPILDKKSYLIRNPMVNNSMARTNEMIYRYLMDHRFDTLHEVDAFWLSGDEVNCFHTLLMQLKLQRMSAQAMFTHFIEQMQLRGRIRPLSLKYVMNPSNELLLQYFLMSMELDKKASFVLQYPLLQMHEALLLANVISMEEISDMYENDNKELDVTRKFLSFLERIRLKLSSEVVLLDGDDELDTLQMQYQELVERFPNLQKKQISFYINHRTMHRYYCIQDFMKFHGVCYETARYSLDELVKQKWYQKQKMGKKFVYYII